MKTIFVILSLFLSFQVFGESAFGQLAGEYVLSGDDFEDTQMKFEKSGKVTLTDDMLACEGMGTIDNEQMMRISLSCLDPNMGMEFDFFLKINLDSVTVFQQFKAPVVVTMSTFGASEIAEYVVEFTRINN